MQIDVHNQIHNENNSKEYVCFYYDCGMIFQTEEKMQEHFDDPNIHKKCQRIKGLNNPFNKPSLSTYLSKKEKSLKNANDSRFCSYHQHTHENFVREYLVK